MSKQNQVPVGATPKSKYKSWNEHREALHRESAETRQGFGSQPHQGQATVQSGQQQFQPRHFDEALPSEYRAVLEDLSWLRRQTKWAAEQAHHKFHGSGIERTLADISEIAELNEILILSNSSFVHYELDTFCRVATETIQQLQQYQQEPFMQAVVSDLSRAIHSANELLTASQATSHQGSAQL